MNNAQKTLLSVSVGMVLLAFGSVLLVIFLLAEAEPTPESQNARAGIETSSRTIELDAVCVARHFG